MIHSRALRYGLALGMLVGIGVGGWFWLRDRAPRAATVWLCAALLAGTALGLAQQIRGAHFMSHTLWTAWLCWTVAGAVWWALRRWAAPR